MTTDYLKGSQNSSNIWYNLRGGHINSGKKICFNIGKRNQNRQVINRKVEVEVESGRIPKGVLVYSLIPQTMIHEHIPLSLSLSLSPSY